VAGARVRFTNFNLIRRLSQKGHTETEKEKNPERGQNLQRTKWLQNAQNYTTYHGKCNTQK
jgi:hypothetical protein